MRKLLRFISLSAVAVGSVLFWTFMKGAFPDHDSTLPSPYPSVQLAPARPVIGPELDVYDLKQPVHDNSNQCVPLGDLQPSISICIHNPMDDKWISATLERGYFWEHESVMLFQRLLVQNPDLHLIDLGANLGQYTLLAAHAGRNALAVEARLTHVRMLHHSLVLNGLQERVTLLHNAISDRPRLLRLAFYPDNQGAAHVIEGSPRDEDAPPSVYRDEQIEVRGVRMNDLVPLLAGIDKVVLKIDIEGDEDKAFRAAGDIFRAVFVPYIFMEWSAMRKKSAYVTEPLLEFFRSRKYSAYGLDDNEIYPLDVRQWKTWPFDVFFKHESVEF